MFNIKTVLSVFNEKGTLLKWLQKVEEALKNDTLTGVQISQPTATTAQLTFNFKDGTTLDSDIINLPPGPQGIPGKNGTDGAPGAPGTDGRGILTIASGNPSTDPSKPNYTVTPVTTVYSDGTSPSSFNVYAKNGAPGGTSFVLTSTVIGLTASAESQTIQINVNSGIGTPIVGQSLEIYSYIDNTLYRFMGTITNIADMGSQTVLTITTVAGSMIKVSGESPKLYRHYLKIHDTQYIPYCWIIAYNFSATPFSLENNPQLNEILAVGKIYPPNDSEGKNIIAVKQYDNVLEVYYDNGDNPGAIETDLAFIQDSVTQVK